MQELQQARPDPLPADAAASSLSVAVDGIVPPESEDTIKASILLVDDKPQNLVVLAEMLRGLNQNVVQAQSGSEALHCLLRQDFAIILADIQMPDMSGYELAALIRQRQRSAHVPIIFITATSREDEDISQGYALGAVDYVFKPVDPVVLKAKVSVFVELFKKTEEIRRNAETQRQLQVDYLAARAAKLEAERALQEVEERQALIIRSLPIALYTAELNGRFSGPRFLSESMAAAVGFEASAFIADPDLWTSRIHPDDLARVQNELGALSAGATLATEYRWRCADGSERVFIDQGVPLCDAAGAPREILGTCLDVTERRRLEHQLAQSQKMEALGQLTGGIAHDFNNMLSVIIWNLDRVAQSVPPGKLHEQAQMAMSGALNCAELTRQLLTFARHQPDQPKLVRLPELGARVARLLSPVIGKHIEINIRMGEGVWPIYADPARVESALLNLAINARDAMEKGGILTIEGGNVPRGTLDMDSSGDFVALCVCDNGIGMSQDVIERAFEPFFTTKSAGEGTGLGLAMVYSFAKQARGHVKIESQVGLGTAVRIYLPRCRDLSAAAEGTDGEDEIKPGKARLVLVVEDDSDVRAMTVARLTEFGYRVREADCGAAALKSLKEEGPVDLMFTDVVMPGINGLDLARRAVQQNPKMKVIFSSGYASSFHRADEELGELLQKPYSNEALRGALRRALVDGSAKRPMRERFSERV